MGFRFPIQSILTEVHSKRILSNAVLFVRKRKNRKHSTLNLKLKLNLKLRKGFLINNYFNSYLINVFYYYF